MAEELRWANLHAFALSDDTDNAASWKNETGHDVTIRDLSMSTTASLPQNAALHMQVSKQVSLLSADGDSNWQENAITNQNNIGDVGTDANGYLGAWKDKKYGRGQIIVEDGETVYMHLYVTGTPGSSTLDGKCTIGFHAL